MTHKKNRQRIIALIFCLFSLQQGHAEPALRLIGSSSVYPFAVTVAEHFSYKAHEPVPLVESVGTGTGVKLFCVNPQGPDIAMASRPFSPTEEEVCQKNGVTFEKFTIGQDGLVLIEKKSKNSFSLTLQDLTFAISENIQLENECLKNRYKTWQEIQPNLPSFPIRVLGPAPNQGTYDVLVDKLSNPCGHLLRQDGTYIEAAANENLIIQKVINTPDTFGIVTFGFYTQNKNQLNALSINGLLPSLESIQKGSYPLSRPLFIYVRTNQIREHPARRAFVLEFMSPDAIGDKGYLIQKGLIPLAAEEQKAMRERADKL